MDQQKAFERAQQFADAYDGVTVTKRDRATGRLYTEMPSVSKLLKQWEAEDSSNGTDIHRTASEGNLPGEF